ncbi:glycosyltransferase family 39 protein [Akkermansiaceae bacterium]|nr:glycosyltransferase family 39 protein [Akkermansiaceae bacterium]
MRTILFTSFSIKIVVLLSIFFLKNGEISGFHGDTVINDDVRYEKAGLFYSQNATSIIDTEVFTFAFEQYGDRTGHARQISVWHWFVCIFTYLFKYSILLRIFNIGLSLLTAYYIFKLGYILFGKKTAKIGLILYSFNPYFIVFPLFLYKDQLVALVLTQIFYFLLMYLKGGSVKYLGYLVGLLAVFSGLRSGFVLAIIAAIIALLTFRESGSRTQFYSLARYSKTKWSLVFLTIFIIPLYFGTTYFIDNFSLGQRKFESYVVGRVDDNADTISIFQITGLIELYRAPLAFVFGLLQPINLTSRIVSIGGFVGMINLFGIVLASGNVLAVFDRRIRSLKFTWIIHCLFLITLISSLGISRHYYFLLQFYVIFLAAFIVRKDNFEKLQIVSFALGLFIIGFYIVKK